MLKKIRVEELTLGMHIHELCGSWIDHPFWRSKFVVTDPEDLRRVRECGITELWIDIAKGLDVNALSDIAETGELARLEPMALMAAPRDESSKWVPMAEELKRAAKLVTKGKKAVSLMFQEVRMGKAISSDAAGELVEDITTSVMRNPGALINLARLKTVDDYTYMHSVAVCALMVALAKQLNLDEQLTRQSGLAGLLHDMGKALMPEGILNKPGKLSNEEFAIVKRHPVQGHKALLEGGSVGEIPLDVCLHHHEKINGTGYPDRLAGDQISLYAKMGAVCDVYDAVTSNRPYNVGWNPADTISKMTDWCNGHFDEKIFQAFVKCIGIYPVGSLVRMKSGRLGVVVEQSEKSLLTPTVKVFFSTKSQAHIKPEVHVLSQPGTTEKIAGREDPNNWGFINLEQLWLQL